MKATKKKQKKKLRLKPESLSIFEHFHDVAQPPVGNVENSASTVPVSNSLRFTPFILSHPIWWNNRLLHCNWRTDGACFEIVHGVHACPHMGDVSC